jgi:hypothetical protein
MTKPNNQVDLEWHHTRRAVAGKPMVHRWRIDGRAEKRRINRAEDWGCHRHRQQDLPMRPGPAALDRRGHD